MPLGRLGAWVAVLAAPPGLPSARAVVFQRLFAPPPPPPPVSSLPAGAAATPTTRLSTTTPSLTTPHEEDEEDVFSPPRPVQVVVDIDDTVKSSGNVRLGDVPLGGIDGQYDRGVFYPGVFDFVAELSRGPHEDGVSKSKHPPEPVAVLTARAREFLFALELTDDDKVCRAFRRAGKRQKMPSDWGVAYERVLYGSAHEWLFQDFKAWRKFANFEILAESLGDLSPSKGPSLKESSSPPKREYVFVGDTGEMDRQAGELILSRHPTLARTVFLHCVSPSPTGDDSYVPVDYAVGSFGRVCHFRTYVGAAFKAVKVGLLSIDGFERVADAALRDLDDRGVFGPDSDPRNQRRDVERDLEQARKALCLLNDDEMSSPTQSSWKRRRRRSSSSQRLSYDSDDSDDASKPLIARVFAFFFFGSQTDANDKTPSSSKQKKTNHQEDIIDSDDDDGWCYNRDNVPNEPWWDHPVAAFFLQTSTKPRRSKREATRQALSRLRRKVKPASIVPNIPSLRNRRRTTTSPFSRVVSSSEEEHSSHGHHVVHDTTPPPPENAGPNVVIAAAADASKKNEPAVMTQVGALQ